MKIFKPLVVFFFFGLMAFFLSFPKISFARIPVGECNTQQECEEMTGGDPTAYCDIATHNCIVSGYFPRTSVEEFQKVTNPTSPQNLYGLQNWAGGLENGFLTITQDYLITQGVGYLDWQQLRAEGKIENFHAGGALGVGTNLISSLYANPPASGREYFADLINNLGFTNQAYAQGVGFTQLRKLLPLWKASRDLSYLLFVLIFIATGLAIMLRVKLDPKTVISVQNAIPKFIIAFILITFSYAIAGLLIDFIYVIITLGIVALKNVPGMGSIAAEQAKYTSLSFTDAFGTIFGGSITATVNVLGGILGAGALLAVFGVVAGLLASTGVGIAVASLPILILLVVVLILVFKLFFSLVGCYINIIISIIIGPLQIAFGVLPGGRGGFESWFKKLAANVLVFPAVALTILIGWLLARQPGADWVPPVLGGQGGQGMVSIVALGMLLVVNKIPQIVKSMFDKKARPIEFGTAIGEAFGPATGAYSLVKSGVTKSATGFISGRTDTTVSRMFGGGKKQTSTKSAVANADGDEPGTG